jgi:hypothetical protein
VWSAKRFCPEDEAVQYVVKDGQLVEKFGDWTLKKDYEKKLTVPAAPPRAARALNFSGAQLLKLQAASSATHHGSKRKDRSNEVLKIDDGKHEAAI